MHKHINIKFCFWTYCRRFCRTVCILSLYWRLPECRAISYDTNDTTTTTHMPNRLGDCGGALHVCFVLARPKAIVLIDPLFQQVYNAAAFRHPPASFMDALLWHCGSVCVNSKMCWHWRRAHANAYSWRWAARHHNTTSHRQRFFVAFADGWVFA